MAAYFSGSNMQADAVQTLHLMNPGYAGYTDASNSGNLVSVSPAGVGQNNSVGNNNPQQQQYSGFSLPPAAAPSPLGQQSALTTMYSSTLGQQSTPSLFTNRANNHPYNWTTVNEISFLPPNDVAQINQSLAARLISMNPGQNSTSDMFQFNMRHQALHDEQASMLNRNAISQASTGPSQGLSLSLSPQQHPVQLQYYSVEPDNSGMSNAPGLNHIATENDSDRGERAQNKWVGNLSHFRVSSQDGLNGTSFQHSMNDVSNRHMQVELNVPTVVRSGGFLTGSKYLKAAQLLLDEVVSVGRGIRRSPSKYVKPQSWMAPSSHMDLSLVQKKSLAETVSTSKEGLACTSSMPTTASGSEQQPATHTELTPQERQELQMKRAKLMAMLDEVDRRYKQYYNQMQVVISSFESAAGFGAAKSYTNLALQTISRHFRCLRDAISGQIRVASRALGEEDPSSPGLGRGEVSQLRFVDQQLRQQRALQQLGMMQQQAWRPQRGLPERSVSVLRAWLFEHFLHPYPKDADKIMLARQTGLTRNQVSNWFINARVRLWKPMVEEMYLEETKESEVDGTPPANQRCANGEENDEFRSGLVDQGGGGNSDNGSKGSDDGTAAETEMLCASSDHISSNDARDMSEKQGAKKARNGMVIEEGSSEIWMEKQEMKREEGKVEAYQVRHAQEGLEGASRYAGAGNGLVARSYGVSLTLGLQHCDGNQQQQHQHQHYLHPQSYGNGDLVAELGGGRFSATGVRRRPEDVLPQDFYSCFNDNSSSSSSLEAFSQQQLLQNRKRFATSQLLHHHFVA